MSTMKLTESCGREGPEGSVGFEADLPVDELWLSSRVRSCLRRCGIYTLSQLVERTAGDLLCIPGFGEGCLHEVERELLARGLSLRREVAANGAEFTQGPKTIDGQPLERAVEELMRWAGVPERCRRALEARLGWPNGRPRSLREAGDLVGLTRERVRQIQERFEKRVRGQVRLSALERALVYVQGIVPTKAESASSALIEVGLSGGLVHPAALARLAAVLGLEPGFEVVKLPSAEDVVVPAGMEAKATTSRRVVSELRRRARPFGFIHLDLARGVVAATGREAEVAELALATVGAVALGGGWFYLRTGRREPVVKLLQDMLAVAGGELSGREALEGLSRRLRFRASTGHHAQNGWQLSTEAVLGLARLRPELFRVEGDRIISVPPLDWRTRLTGPVRVMVEVLYAAPGRVLSREAFEQEVVARGVKANTFNAYSSYSPFVKELGMGLWSLRGVEPDPLDVERLRRRATPRREKIEEWRWLPTGVLRVAVRLHRIQNLVVALPGPLRPYVSGRIFEVRLPSGRVGAKVRVDAGGNSWGYGALLGRIGAKVGDVMLADFDIASGTVAISLRASGEAADA